MAALQGEIQRLWPTFIDAARLVTVQLPGLDGDGLLSVLPMDMPCHMDAFGLITRTDRLLSPGAKVLMKALKQTCLTQYGVRLNP